MSPKLLHFVWSPCSTCLLRGRVSKSTQAWCLLDQIHSSQFSLLRPVLQLYCNLTPGGRKQEAAIIRPMQAVSSSLTLERPVLLTCINKIARVTESDMCTILFTTLTLCSHFQAWPPTMESAEPEFVGTLARDWAEVERSCNYGTWWRRSCASAHLHLLLFWRNWQGQALQMVYDIGSLCSKSWQVKHAQMWEHSKGCSRVFLCTDLCLCLIHGNFTCYQRSVRSSCQSDITCRL